MQEPPALVVDRWWIVSKTRGGVLGPCVELLTVVTGEVRESAAELVDVCGWEIKLESKFCPSIGASELEEQEREECPVERVGLVKRCWYFLGPACLRDPARRQGAGCALVVGETLRAF